jgi:hypothetical protein
VGKKLQDSVRISLALAELVESPIISVSTYRDAVALQKKLEREITELRRTPLKETGAVTSSHELAAD